MFLELRHFDTPLLRFDASTDTAYPVVSIHWINEQAKYLLPLGMDLSSDGISSWLCHRTIPKNRAFVMDFLASCGLPYNRPISILSVSYGLSLTDCYWLAPENFNGKFYDYNLYDNKFSRILATIAFTGYGSVVRKSLVSCPEFTTNGMLPKCWRRLKGKIYLFKGGTSGASNTGMEPYSEFYVCQVAQALGIKHISYALSRWQGYLCSVCELFTSKSVSFIPIGYLVSGGCFNDIVKYYKINGYISALADMLILDALILNTDRHCGNFGFLVDSISNKIIGPAPLFDHGLSLLNFAGNYLENKKMLDKYIKELYPATYPDFIDTARGFITHEKRDKIRSLFNFRFKRHARYNLSKERLQILENIVQNQAKKLLKN